MAQYTINISKDAQCDIIDIVYYIAVELGAPETAERFSDDINQSIKSLEHMPHRYPVIDGERKVSPGFRKLHIKNYIAFYTINEDTRTVNIERILYVRRNWQHIL